MPDTIIAPTYAEMQYLIDQTEDPEDIAEALLSAIRALIDITGDDATRPAVNRPGKVARRAITRVRELLEESIEKENQISV